MTDAQAAQYITQSGIYELIDQARLERRLTVRIPENLWNELFPLARQLCGEYFRYMLRPWRSFMLDGTWIEQE